MAATRPSCAGDPTMHFKSSLARRVGTSEWLLSSSTKWENSAPLLSSLLHESHEWGIARILLNLIDTNA